MASYKINLSPLASPTDDLERLRGELAECEDRALRLRADFDNFRRRVAREREGASVEGRRAALGSILPVLDSLDLAIAAGSTDRGLLDGIVATRKLFLDALRENGAEPIEALGKKFDPTVHEAVGAMPAAHVEPGTVVREVRGGWRLGKDLLRAPQVIVSTAGALGDD